MTKAKQGFQPGPRLRNEIILSGLVMPEIASPTLNIAPTKKVMKDCKASSLLLLMRFQNNTKIQIPAAATAVHIGFTFAIYYPLSYSLVKITRFKISAAAIPRAMNRPIATNDLLDSRGIPQTPCPDVHPFASFAPSPTRNPAIAQPSKESLSTLTTVMFLRQRAIAPAKTIPSNIGNLQQSSCNLSTLKTSPLMPVTLPYRQRWSEEARPRRSPPSAPQRHYATSN